MGRLVNSGSASKDRILLERGIVLALRELVHQSNPDDDTRDLIAYITLSLWAIADTIDVSVGAWEKRGYWVKADRFRMEWSWTKSLGDDLYRSVIEDDWVNLAQISAQVGEKLKAVKIPQRHHMGTPWVDAWQRLISPKQGH